ncbi:hypothetical protein DPMN_159182, partial [Dreissena polymorpha]
IVYSICMTSAAVLSIICVIRTCIRDKPKDGYEDTRRATRNASKCWLCPVVLLLPISALAVTISRTNMLQFVTREITHSPQNNSMVPIKWLLGFLFGVTAAITKLCGKFTDVYIAFTYVDTGQRLSRVLIFSVVGDLCYVISVYTYSLTREFAFLTLPWTLPRLVAAGIDTGITVQRLLQDKSRRNRKLSQDDAEKLLSSDVEISSDGSEEVIWVPLKAMDYARPQYSVGTTRMHIISDADSYAESTIEDTAYDGDSEDRGVKTKTSNGARASRSVTPALTQQQEQQQKQLQQLKHEQRRNNRCLMGTTYDTERKQALFT